MAAERGAEIMNEGKVAVIPGLASLERVLLPATVCICGAAVMEVEVLGTRIVSPWFGVSLFVWTGLITVTLLSLSAGYFPSKWEAGSSIGYTLVGRVPGVVQAPAPRALLPVHPMALPALDGFFKNIYTLPEGAGGVYTDDWAPLEAQNAPIKLLWRRSTIESTPADILLN